MRERKDTAEPTRSKELQSRCTHVDAHGKNCNAIISQRLSLHRHGLCAEESGEREQVRGERPWT